MENIESTLIDVFNITIEKDSYFGIGPHFCNVFFRALQDRHKERAKEFLFDYSKKHNNDPSRMNVVVDIVRHSMKELFEDILLLFISLNQDVNIFSEIWWCENGGTTSGNELLGDIKAAEWREILSVVEKSDIGIKLLPIKRYVTGKIEKSLRDADWDRKRRFLERSY